VGTTTEAQTVTLYNPGDGAFILSGTGLGISISGVNASSYSQTNTCSMSVPSGGSCAIMVTFSPATSGTLNATVSIAGDLDKTPQTVPLIGTGIAAAGSPANGSGNVYYVDNTIPDINVASATPDCTTYNPTTFVCGTGSAMAFATVADISSKAFNPGDTILFRRGEVWREQLMDIQGGHMSNGSVGEPITYSAFGDAASPLPVISGANLFSDWLPEQVAAGAAAATVYCAPYTVTPSTDGNYESGNYATIPSQVFEDGKRLTQNTTSVNSLAVGQWYLDTANSVIWARLTGDDNPRGHTIEASQRDYAIELYQDISYITICNLQTEDTNFTGIDLGAGGDNNIVISGVISINNYVMGIHIVYSANDTIKSSAVAYNGGEGINIFQSPSILIDGNTIHNNGQLSTVPTYDQASALNGGGPLTTNIIVQNNLIYSNGVAGGVAGLRGMDFDTIGEGAIIRYNKIYSNTGDGIELDADSGESVYGNVIYGNGASGIRAFADSQPTPMTDMKIYNNTVFGNYGVGIELFGPTMSTAIANGCVNNSVINNIAVNTINGPNLFAGGGCDNNGGLGSGNVYNFNDFGAASSNFIEWGILPTGPGYPMYESTYEAWESAPGNCGGTGCSHSVESEPLLTSASTYNFTLSQYSPAIGAGLNLGLMYQYEINPASAWPANIILNSQNSTGGGWTIGAYTFTYHPL
jgi:parallel beta-helix repeat protein